MRKLISANFSRLWKDKFFWIAVVAMPVFVLNGCRQATESMSEFGYTLGHYFFRFLPMFGSLY